MFILLGIHVITRRRVQKRRGEGGGWQKTRQRYDKSLTSSIYTTWPRTLSDRNVFCTLRGRGKRRGLMPLGLFLVFYPAVRTGSSNTHFFSVVFFLVVTCPRPPVFARPNKYSSCLSLHRQGLLS